MWQFNLPASQNMKKKLRLNFLLVSLALLIALGWLVEGNFNFLLHGFWFTSGFLLLILLSLVDQPFFSKDSNIFVNAITAGMALLIMQPSYRYGVYYMCVGLVAFLVISSFIVMMTQNQPLSYEKKWVQFLSRINRQLGKPQIIFSVLFIWGIINDYNVISTAFNVLLGFWALFIVVSSNTIWNILSSLWSSTADTKNDNALGQIFGVQAKSTFLARLSSNIQETIDSFDCVEFLHSVNDGKGVRKGLVLDSYLLNEEHWIKVITTNEINELFGKAPCYSNHVKGIIYKVQSPLNNDFIDRFVGIVTEKSNIGKIRFIYNSRVPVQEGQLLEVCISPERIVYYQIVDGVTKIEQLESKNESGLIIGEAIQLGTWNQEKAQFEQFGWVPEVNTPVYLASPIQEIEIGDGEYKIGEIPSTNFPVILDKNLAITHHTAVLGVTGTGKSVFSRNLIREYLKDPAIKVVCIDFTGEYKCRFNASELMSQQVQGEVYKLINWVSKELEKFGNQQDKENLTKANASIKKIIKDNIDGFLKDDKQQITILELPDVSNTASILEYTRQLFQVLFDIAKRHRCYGHKVCVVLEEAHTVIPEWNFVGVAEKSSQSLLNSIAQIALQGRKYDVGLLVIAQRTANVSKTILTQCNTIISFQEFDKTSSEFLSNYFGENIARVLPNLRFRQAIAAGKALRSNVPMIFEVPVIIESKPVEPVLKEPTTTVQIPERKRQEDVEAQDDFDIFR